MTIETFPDVGHSDILDDTWAEIAKKIPWISGARMKQVKFREWDVRGSKNPNVNNIRANYRRNLATRAIEHILA